MLLVLILLLVCQLVGYSSAQCPTGCSCLQNNRRIRCTAAGFTEIPNFPADIRGEASEIDLRSNVITSIDATDFQGISSLTDLDLSGNQISFIEEGSFSSTTLLETLDLSSNMLREIPDDIFESTQLIELILRNNDIANISMSTFTGVQLDAIIDLDGNVIQTIPEDTFSNLQRLDELSLSGNPFHCDCRLRWFPAFRESIRVDTTGTCATPPNLNGMSLQQITREQLVCECIPPCMNGACNTTIGECECSYGYVGDYCDTPCPIGTFGEGCSQNCTCLAEHESSPCEHVDGTCHCLPGYTGSSCEQECPEGFYGQDCLDICQCEHGSCDFITGFCNCSIGYIGTRCNIICPPLRYGLRCNETCSCETGNCHHITGECSCPVGYFGSSCDHNCTEVANCRDIGRVECSLETPEQTCGPCLPGYVGEEGNGTSECILCSGAPDCTALNRDQCSNVANTCGPCFQRHLTVPGQEGFSNEPCFDPCIDGIRNYNEADIDCGGPLCPPCNINQSCTTSSDCGLDRVCLGFYTHPSGLDFPFDVRANRTCVAANEPGNSITRRFINAFQGRENPLPDIAQNPHFTLEILEASVEREIMIQFNVPKALESIYISHLDQEPGDPLYQTNIKLCEAGAEESFDQMIENIHKGRLLGSTLFNRLERKVLYNF